MQVRGHERGSGTLQAAAAGAIVRADAVVDRALLGRMPNLRVLARTGVGVDLVDVAAATERGIAVVITPGSGWAQRHQVDVGDLEGSTIGIVGYGRIGQRVGQLARAFGMRVLAYDPVTIPPDDVRCAALSDIATGSDVITLHAPLTEATRHLVNCRFLSVVRPGALLINCGRGALVDADAVLDALVAGRLAGVGLDVFEPEPPAHHPLFDHPDVVLTPHLMGLSRRATAATFADAARGVADVLAGRRPAALANPGWAPPADGRLADGERP